MNCQDTINECMKLPCRKGIKWECLEEYMVIEFFLDHWINYRRHIKTLQKKLLDAGFEKDYDSIKKKLDSYHAEYKNQFLFFLQYKLYKFKKRLQKQEG